MRVERGNGVTALERVPAGSLHAVFLDPPFESPALYEPALRAAARALRPEGVVYLEAPGAGATTNSAPLGLVGLPPPEGRRGARAPAAARGQARLHNPPNQADGGRIRRKQAMSSNVIAVYPGTFDPMTLGHEDVVRRATQLFSQVIVAVAAGHHKKALFTLQERIDMARDAVEPYSDQVTVESFSGLLRDFVVARGGKAMVRGLRAVTDFDYEFQLAGMNRSLMPEVETVFLTPSDKYQFISSTFVREIAMLGGEVDKFVSPKVAGQPAWPRSAASARE